jgi:hypothetical protein
MSTFRLVSLLSCATLSLFGVSSCGSGGGEDSPRISDPAAGSFWSGSRVIRWTPLETSGEVTIELSDGAGWETIVEGSEDDGRYRWNTSTAADGGTYRVRVRTAHEDPLVSGVFTLDNTAPAIVLTSPVGGELWGGSRDITWTTLDTNPEFVDLLVSNNSGASYDLALGVAAPDDGLHTWETGTEPDGTTYRAQIMATDKAGNSSGMVSSLMDFELDNTAPQVTLTAPLGGEDWDLERSVTWLTSDPNPGTVELELSTNSGASYDQLVVSAAPDTGSYAWATGYAPDGDAMRMRVTATDGAGNVSGPDVSPGDFTVTNLRLLDPVHYLDVNLNAEIDAGDELYLLYDKEIVVNDPSVDDLSLPVANDGFGDGAVVSMGPELHAVVVILGTDPVLRTRGAFSTDETSPGRPGAIDISTSMTPDAIEDALTGRDAAPSGPKDIISGFVVDEPMPAWGETASGGALGDLDGDGDLDLVVTSTGGGADVCFSGDGAGWWSVAQSFGTTDSRDVALGDLDGDGDLDAVVAAGGANLVWTNDGQGNLVDSGLRLGASDSLAVLLADLDGDGDLDLAFGNGSNQVDTIWWNDGAGSFTDSGQALCGSTSAALAAGDLDLDGDLDLVVAVHGANSCVLLNDGTGQFSLGVVVTLTDAQDVALGDLNGDGRLDAFFAALGQSEVMLGDGQGGFGPTWDYLGNNDHRAVCLIDLDGDGDLDGVTAKYLDSERFWLNDGNARFKEDPRRGRPDNSTDVLVGNVDGDGDLDLVLVNDLHAHRTYRSSLAGGQPSASLVDSGTSLGDWVSGRAAAGDVDGDGDLDLIVPDRTGTVGVLLGDGAGALEPGTSFGDTDGRGGALFDADQDGDLDYLQWIGDPGTIIDVLWLGDGNGGFSAAPVTLGADTLPAGDLDRDGDDDLVVVGATQFEVWDGDGAGGFSPSGQTGTTSGLVQWAFGDLDSDGDLDMVYARDTDLQIWAGDGAGGLSLATTITPGGVTADLSVTDYDCDGDSDLVVATDQGLAMLRNDGGLSFSSMGTTGPAVSLSQVLAMDFNEDGYTDFLVIAEEASSYYMVAGDGTNSLSTPPATMVTDMAWGITVDLDSDGDLDVYWSCGDTLSFTAAADRVDLFD